MSGHNKNAACALLLAAAATAMCAPASAQQFAELQGGDVVTVTANRPAYRETDNTSATRTDLELRDVPQAVSVITNDLIEDQAMSSMADVVRYVPGVTMGTGEGNRDQLTLRGNGTTADFFVDGVRDDVQYFRDLYNSERIEVLKGPNSMIFGRGGGGGVINRVSEWADWTPTRELDVVLGSNNQARISSDLGAAPSQAVALRLNAFYEQADSFRDHVELERYGFNPTATLRLSDSTEVRVGFEHFSDWRTADRGVPSQDGRPYAGSRSAFFGNPEQSYADAEVNLFSASIAHEFSPNLRLRSTLRASDYDKFYQNVHANSAIDANGDVTLQAYNNATERSNLFSQTDLVWTLHAGGVTHTLLAGFEIGSQESDNARVPNAAPGIVNISNPTIFTPVTFSTTLQTDNNVQVDVAALLLQDHIALGDQWSLIAGLRFDRFEMQFDDHRAANADFSRTDAFVSPRLGLVYKPVEALSLYASYSVSFLPQSGDQFSSLNANSSELDPEEFENTELGFKWDATPDLALSAAIYRLDRTNTTAIDPMTSLTVLTGAQRSKGLEIEIAGSINEHWEIIGGYAYQKAEISRTTSAAPAGGRVPLTPEHSASLWSNYNFTPNWGAGLGLIHQSESYASISNAVELPSFSRVDAALFWTVSPTVEAQLNVENILGEEYWPSAHNDNNIGPGAPTSVRVALRTRF
jgi:catecholate siderophore receptor